MNILEAVQLCKMSPQKIGNMYRTFCPFHQDKNTPNFIIYPDTNSYWCYACSDGGGIIKFLRKMGYKGNLTKMMLENFTGLPDIKKSNYRNILNRKVAEFSYDFFTRYPDYPQYLLKVLEKFDDKLLSKEYFDGEEASELLQKFQKIYDEMVAALKKAGV